MAKKNKPEELEPVAEELEPVAEPVSEVSPAAEDVEESEKGYAVEILADVPYGPKAGVRIFEKKADAKAYAERFGGKLL